MARILLTEDDDSVRAFVGRALELDGHEIVTAADGAQAMEIVTAQRAAFDLLLADIKMPVMDGIALALNVARDWPQLTVVLMTGYADQRERADGLDAIVRDVINKPFTLVEIRQRVKAALGKAAPGSGEAMAGAAGG